MTINLFAAFINLLVLIGLTNIFIETFIISNFNLGSLIIVFVIYILLCNLIRLIRIRKRLYIFGNKLVFRNMFGFKKSIMFDSNIDITNLKLERQNNLSNKSKLFIARAILACININYGCVLICRNRKILSGVSCSNQNMILLPASQRMLPQLKNRYR